MQELDRVPLIRDRGREFRERVEGRTTVVFLDCDRTLTPVAKDCSWSSASISTARRLRIGDDLADTALADCDDVRRFLELRITLELESP